MGGLVGGVGLTLAAQGPAMLLRLHEPVDPLGGTMLAMGYAATIIVCVSLPAGQKKLAWAAPIGRMAFTNYLAQSLILGWIFYGYGLGLFGRLAVTFVGIAHRDHGIRRRRCRVLGASCLQHLVAEPVSVRSDRVVVAHVDVWHAATDGRTRGVTRRLLLLAHSRKLAGAPGRVRTWGG